MPGHPGAREACDMITRPDVEKSTTAATRHVWAPRWWLVFPIGLVLWVATVADTFYTNNLILLPTVVLLGSFLVPVTAVVWYLDHDPSPELSPRRIVSAFILSGVLGALAASVLEFWLVFGPGLFGTLKVGFIEELVKGVLVVLFALGIRSRSEERRVGKECRSRWS